MTIEEILEKLREIEKELRYKMPCQSKHLYYYDSDSDGDYPNLLADKTGALRSEIEYAKDQGRLYDRWSDY